MQTSLEGKSVSDDPSVTSVVEAIQKMAGGQGSEGTSYIPLGRYATLKNAYLSCTLSAMNRKVTLIFPGNLWNELITIFLWPSQIQRKCLIHLFNSYLKWFLIKGVFLLFLFMGKPAVKICCFRWRLCFPKHPMMKIILTITLCTRQQERHCCIDQSYGLCGRGRGWGDFGEWHWNMYNIMYETSRQSRFNARYWMLGAGALDDPEGG